MSGKNLRSPFTKQLTGLFCSLRSNPCLYSRKKQEAPSTQDASRFLAEAEGFVLEFCKAFRIGFNVMLCKILRSPFTKQLTGLFCSLRSNPIYILAKNKKHPQLRMLLVFWRRQRDSNPRGLSHPNCFQDLFALIPKLHGCSRNVSNNHCEKA